MSNILATGGNSLKLWDTTNYSLCQDITSTNGAITDLSWSQGGQCLANLGTNKDEISLSAVNAKSAISIGVVRGVENPTCIQFANRNNRYLGVGNKQGSIVIWDIKNQSQKKAFNVMSGPVSGIRFSHNDSHIAASTSKGNIYIVSAINNTTSGPFDIFTNQAVTDLMYNYIKRSLLGISSYSGVVSLFDIYASKLLHSYEAHTAPASSIAFSPINELLMISVGYDKKFNCFNVQTKKPAMTHRSAVPLTSCTFLFGGQHVALGTMTGQVLIHDLRNLRSPLHTLAAHSGKVSCIGLQHLGKTIQSDNIKVSEPAAEAHKSKTSNKEHTPKKLTTEALPNPTTPVKDSEYDKLTIFSPIRQTESIVNPNEHESISYNTNKVAPISGSCDGQWWDDFDSPMPKTAFDTRTALSHGSTTTAASSDIISPVRKVTGGITAGTLDMTSVFSPIRETGSVSAAAKGTIPTTNYRDILFSPVRTQESAIAKAPFITYTTASPEVVDIQKEVDHPNKNISTEFDQLLQNKENHKPSDEPKGKMTKEIINEGKEAISKVSNNKINGNKIETSQILTPVTRTSTTPVSVSSLAIKSARTLSAKKQNSSTGSNTTYGSSKITNTPTHSISRTNPASPRRRQFMRQLQAADLIDNETQIIQDETETLTTEQSPTLEITESAIVGGELQMSLIRSCVRDVIEEFEENVNRRFMNLHSHFVKEFIQQQELMKELFKMHSLNDELVEEVQRLQEENRHLRANY